jgi:putative membrane protein
MRGKRWQGRLTLTAMVAVLAAGCDRADRAQADSVVERAGEAVGAAVDTVSNRIRGREYSNTEMLGFINRYNDAEIEMAALAGPKATDAEVKAFATRIAADHKALKAAVATAAASLNLTPAAPDDDEDLAEDHMKGMQELRDQARGREFDEKFLEHEIRMHRKALDEIKDALDANRNPEIRALLEQARAGTQAHLTAAEDLEKKFGTS